MRRLVPVVGLVLLLTLAGCATPSGDGTDASPVAESPTSAVSETPAVSDEAAAAQAQAQAWLAAAVMPEGAVESSTATGAFSSYQGWPCQPVEQIEAFWTIPGAAVADTAEWLRTNPPANLVTTATGAVYTDEITEANIGFIPADGSYQGVVYTVAQREDGVAVRAQIAALTTSATCPTPDGGGTWGPPGQG